MRRHRYVLTAALMFLSAQAWGWGSVGHRTTGHIAQVYLSPQARQAVAALLQGQSLADVANWADSLKKDPTTSHTAWYHFEKIDDGIRLIDAIRSQPPEQQKKGGLIAAILIAQRTLETRQSSFADKSVALKFLVHFIGDLHQPLHSGRVADKGGNKIPVTWFGKEVNLHSVWDGGLIYTGHEDLFRNLPTTADYSVPYARWLLENFRNNVPPAGTRDNVEAWLNESMQIRPGAYDPMVQTNQPLYQQKNLRYVDWRVHTAGIRIADTLNRIFAGQVFPNSQRDLTRQLERIVGSLMSLITLGPRAVQEPVPAELWN